MDLLLKQSMYDSVVEEASKISGVSKIIHIENDEYNNILAEKLTSAIINISDNYNYFCLSRISLFEYFLLNSPPLVML